MFKGLYVALVTPFDAGGELDEERLRRLVALHVESGTHGLVPCGTTGENPTFTPEEHERVVRIVADEAKGRLQVVAGAGSNDTKTAVRLATRAVAAGADGLLVITPYYNKPQPDGLIAHFRAVAAAVQVPIMMYNVPGRTGVNMMPETVERACEIEHVVAIKEASGDVNQSSDILRRCGERMTVLAGDDSLCLPIMAVGGRGVVSVVGNLVPERMRALVDDAIAGRWDAARRRHLELYELCQAMFIESNPAPIKYGMSAAGLGVGEVRPPLAPLREASRVVLDGVLGRARLTHAGTAG